MEFRRLEILPAAYARSGLAILGAEILAAEGHPLELPNICRVGDVEHLALPRLHTVAEIDVCQAVEHPNNLKRSHRRREFGQEQKICAFRTMLQSKVLPVPSWASWQRSAGCKLPPLPQRGTSPHHRSSRQGAGRLARQTPGSQARGSAVAVPVRQVLL